MRRDVSHACISGKKTRTEITDGGRLRVCENNPGLMAFGWQFNVLLCCSIDLCNYHSEWVLLFNSDCCHCSLNVFLKKSSESDGVVWYLAFIFLRRLNYICLFPLFNEPPASYFGSDESCFRIMFDSSKWLKSRDLYKRTSILDSQWKDVNREEPKVD